MSLETISSVAMWVFIALAIGSTIFHIKKELRVKGSHGRYVMKTLQLVCDFGQAVTLVIVASCYFALALPVFASLIIGALLYRIWDIWKHFDDDDHWFNDQWKKLKKGYKKLRQRLANGRLSPLPSPA